MDVDDESVIDVKKREWELIKAEGWVVINNWWSPGKVKKTKNKKNKDTHSHSWVGTVKQTQQQQEKRSPFVTGHLKRKNNGDSAGSPVITPACSWWGLVKDSLQSFENVSKKIQW